MKKGELSFAFLMLAERTGLEPATPGVTGRYSNQLNYHSIALNVSAQITCFFIDAEIINTLQNCLLARFYSIPLLVGAEGLEPPTSSV